MVAEACTKFCQEQIIIFQIGTNSNLNKLVFWAHKLHAERFPGSAYSSATKQLNTKSYTNKNAIGTCQNKCIGYIKINLNAINWRLTPVSVTIAGMSLFKNNAWQMHRFIRQEWIRACLHCSWNGCKWLDGYVTSGHLQEQWCGWLYPLTLKHVIWMAQYIGLETPNGAKPSAGTTLTTHSRDFFFKSSLVP